MSGKILIVSAPSGAGKSTLVQHLLTCNLHLEFSISATSRMPRGAEIHGVDYYFLSLDDFLRRINNNEFIEYEEVYSGCYYGTLRSEIERITSKGNNVVLDIDVVGGVNVKNIFSENALALFIAPPGIDSLKDRLNGRGTDSAEMIEKRLAKAEFELTFAPKFDKVVVNDNLDLAKQEIQKIVTDFLIN